MGALYVCIQVSGCTYVCVREIQASIQVSKDATNLEFAVGERLVEDAPAIVRAP